jgi:DVNP family
MTRYTKTSSGKYLIQGKSYEKLEGSRAQVYHGTAYKTSGGLKKSDIIMNKNGRIVSKSKHTTAKKERRLIKAGYGTKKGKFGYVKIGSRSSSSSSKSKTKSKRSNKMRGGGNTVVGASENVFNAQPVKLNLGN